MRIAVYKVVVPVMAFVLSSGCSFLLPTSQDTAKSKWTSYTEAKAAFDRVVPGTTPTNELAELGFHPSASPNGRLLTYLDVIPRFLPNGAITRDDLDPAVREFIEAGEDGEAWEIVLNRARSKRKGNALLDLAGFVKKTHQTGWRFNALFLIRNGHVVYKLASGTPNVAVDEIRKRPLGPFQEMDDIVVRSEEDRERPRRRE